MKIPNEWLSHSILQKRIICHWTVTSYDPDEVSIDSYHIIIDGDGKLHRGSSDLDERSPHTYMFNSAIGISLACMGGYVSSANPGQYPPTKEQWESLIEVVKQLSDTYSIPVTPTTVLMHGEVTDNLLVDQWGKWDIGWLPHLGLSGAKACGDELRKRVLGSNDDNVRTPVYVRVSGYSKPIKGFLMDGSAMVPLREFANASEVIRIVKLDMSGSKKFAELSINGEKKTTKQEMLILDEIGHVSLSELCNKMNWTTSVESWTKEKRIVVAKPRA